MRTTSFGTLPMIHIVIVQLPETVHRVLDSISRVFHAEIYPHAAFSTVAMFPCRDWRYLIHDSQSK